MKYRKEIKEYPDNSKGIEFQPNIPPSYWSPKKVEMFVLTLKTFDDQNVPKWRSRFLSSHYFNFDITRAFLWRSGGLKSVLYECLNLSAIAISTKEHECATKVKLDSLRCKREMSWCEHIRSKKKKLNQGWCYLTRRVKSNSWKLSHKL